MSKTTKKRLRTIIAEIRAGRRPMRAPVHAGVRVEGTLHLKV